MNRTDESSTAMTSLPDLLSEFPPLPPSHNWSRNIKIAYDVLYNTYRNATAALRCDDIDSTRVGFHITTITAEAIPILSAMEMENEGDTSDEQCLPGEWISSSAEIFGYLVLALQQAGELAKGWYVIHSCICCS